MPGKTSKQNKRHSPTPADNNRQVFEFGATTHGHTDMRDLLGGKGANLAEMANIGLPVPPGFTLSTEVCRSYLANRRFPAGLEAAVKTALQSLEQQTGKQFGGAENPLLFAVRSGGRESMPGMMDTVLNLGLNDVTVEALAERTQDRRFAYDCYRRLINLYGDVVMGIEAEHDGAPDPFDAAMETLKRDAGVSADSALSAAQVEGLTEQYKSIVREHSGREFPQDVSDQLWGAIGAVFDSWRNERAVLYRRRYRIPESWGTAVNVQSMVFGNMGEDCATGVAFTRDPATGEKRLYGEYLTNAQGEDVVAGTRTPHPIVDMEATLPDSFAGLQRVRSTLERHFRDMQDFEFTIEQHRLYVLQTRNGKRTGLAALRIAVEMNRERLLNQKVALTKIPAESIDSVLVPVFDAAKLASASPIEQGLAAGPGAAAGRISLTAVAAEGFTRNGDAAVLCRTETSPEDLKGMLVADGVLTSRGGVSSHAALVARQLGKVCVCGAAGVSIDYAAKTLTAGGRTLAEGDWISIDGTTGEIFEGAIDRADSEVQRVLSGELNAADSYTYQLFETVMGWADRYRRLKVRANADNPQMARQAANYGAEGIGLCRTEHMFFEGERIDHMRRMILAEDDEQRLAALTRLLPFQRQDFEGLFTAMAPRPVTIRLLDPPLHEFLPTDEPAQQKLADMIGISLADVAARVATMHEQNPMLGFRGCRLGILYPEITEMQCRAIFEAAVNVSRTGLEVTPEIMVPLVGFAAELADQTAIVHRVAAEVRQATNVQIDYQVGTMIEVPRAALTAGDIAEIAEFFSFGTNDLTQTTLGLSRDDMGSFYDGYIDKQIYSHNPFASIDITGVGRLIEEATNAGRATRKKLKLGICGEHAGDPPSIEFCHDVGLDYVSCSGPRVPVARLAAAQAAIRDGG